METDKPNVKELYLTISYKRNNIEFVISTFNRVQETSIKTDINTIKENKQKTLIFKLLYPGAINYAIGNKKEKINPYILMIKSALLVSLSDTKNLIVTDSLSTFVINNVLENDYEKMFKTFEPVLLKLNCFNIKIDKVF